MPQTWLRTAQVLLSSQPSLSLLRPAGGGSPPRAMWGNGRDDQVDSPGVGGEEVMEGMRGGAPAIGEALIREG